MNFFKKKEKESDAPCEATQSIDHAVAAIDAGMKVKRAARKAVQKVAESLTPLDSAESATAKK